MSGPQTKPNVDERSVAGFGEEWAAYDQAQLGPAEFDKLFSGYFRIFPFGALPPNAEGFDLGCGSGRWAAAIAPRVGQLHCIDASPKALDVARRNLAGVPNVTFAVATTENIPLPDDSQDFGYSIGVLHHIPDTGSAIADCVRKLKTGAPFLLYLYYALDGRPGWFRRLWRISDYVRRGVSRLPFRTRNSISTVIAATVYWPLARTARLVKLTGLDASNLPLSPYSHSSFYSMRTDALDRFGTALEQRFTREEIARMMTAAGLADIEFSDREPFWVAYGRKRA